MAGPLLDSPRTEAEPNYARSLTNPTKASVEDAKGHQYTRTERTGV